MNAVSHRLRDTGRAFTLVEMLVVIAIIAILLAALLPAFSGVRQKAKEAAAQAQFTAIETGITLFRSEAALGGGFPPSASDKGSDVDRIVIANPRRQGAGGGGGDKQKIAGAHLLVYAMVGVDGLGTAGFSDVNRSGEWSDDLHDGPGGLYEIDQADGKEKFPRYGAPGYVDQKAAERTRSMTQLVEDGVVLNADYVTGDELATDEPMFIDPWDHPILYYRANPSARHIVGDGQNRGIYWQEDNVIVTGGDGVAGTFDGLDFGAGADAHGDSHLIHDVGAVLPTRQERERFDRPNELEHTFSRFILDAKVAARPTPVNKDGFLLISAGADGVYGSEDDIVNWTRHAQGDQ